MTDVNCLQHDFLKHLNTEQYNIAVNKDFIDQRTALCIIACAGSGKTTTLIAKIIYMITVLHCEPRDFFITTFTKNASNELRERLTSTLGEDIIGKMTIGTFHSIAYSKMIKNNDYVIEDNIESYLHKYSDILCVDDNEYQEMRITAQDGIYDANDVLIDETLDDEDDDNDSLEQFIMTEDHQYKYVFIDEYQDINDVQEKIIKSLYKSAKLLVVVGDDQQNIYTFRKTNIKYILNFDKNYDNASHTYLIKNYRCNTNIVDLANIVLSYNHDKIDKTIVAMNKSVARKIIITSVKNQKEQIEFLIRKLLKICEEDKDNLHKIAIIARNNYVLKILESKLAFHNIPTFYIESNGDNIMAKQLVQNIMGRVILSTIHGTKGLEFDNVYIIDINSSTFPSPRCDDVEEERRLFYVGITRAKNKLYMCYDERQTSIFIDEIIAHPLTKNIITFKNTSIDEDSLKSMPARDPMPADYTIENIIFNLNYLDYEQYSDNIFNYHFREPEIIELHDKIPTYFGEFCEDRNLIVSNISQIFTDFIEVYVSRSVQKIGNERIEYLDYIMYAFKDLNNSIDIIGDRSLDSVIEGRFGIDFKNKSDEEVLNLISYYKSGIKISSFIPDNLIPYFAESYRQYISDKKSKDIIFDIFIISLVKGVMKGRNSILHLINFDKTRFIMEKINKSDITTYNRWLGELETSYINHFIDCHDINASYTLRDEESGIKCMMDLQYGKNIICIKSSTSEKPKVEILLQVLSCVSIARRNNIIISECSIYNPLTGNIYIWDLSDWDGANDTICFLHERYQ